MACTTDVSVPCAARTLASAVLARVLMSNSTRATHSRSLSGQAPGNDLGLCSRFGEPVDDVRWTDLAVVGLTLARQLRHRPGQRLAVRRRIE